MSPSCFRPWCAASRQRNGATKQGAFCGIVVGVLVVAVTTIMHSSVGQLLPFLPDTLKDVNIGFIALTLNVIVFAIVKCIDAAASASEKSHAPMH